MKKLSWLFIAILIPFYLSSFSDKVATAKSAVNKYFVVYDENNNVLLMKGDDVCEGDNYLSSDNKLYEIYSVDNEKRTAKAKFIRNEQMPNYNVSAKKNNSCKK